MTEAAQTTIDQDEVARFSAMAAEWWNPTGKFRPLHKFNPVRLTYIRDHVAAHFGRDPRSDKPFAVARHRLWRRALVRTYGTHGS